MMRPALLVTVATLWLAPVGELFAYPQTVAKGYTNCATCHYSPTGGGMPNSYGHAATQAMLPDLIDIGFLQTLRGWLMKNDVTGYDMEGEAALQWDAGLDARLLITRAPTELRGDPEIVPVPMLIEASAAVAYGPVVAYGSVTPRRQGAERRPDTVMSREHWLQYRIDESSSVRAGRMVLPFGLRLPDHTLYAREEHGFDKWSQAYAAEYDLYTEDWMISLAASAGDIVYEPSDLRETAAVASIVRNIPGRAAIGISLLGAHAELHDRTAVALHARTRLVGSSYLLVEAATTSRFAADADLNQVTDTGFLRAGWFIWESLDVFAEWGGKRVADAPELQRQRYGVGVNWQALPWLEVAPLFLWEERESSGRDFLLAYQVHLLY